MSTLKTIETKVLEIAFLEEGPAAGWPVILAHGFPYDVHAYDEVAPSATNRPRRGPL
jgi:pimeloyl-ACP methyl ester carboxylesterase